MNFETLKRFSFSIISVSAFIYYLIAITVSISVEGWTLAVILVIPMVVAMAPLVYSHYKCRVIVKRSPELMHEYTRDSYRWAEMVMAAACLAQLNYMVMFLPEFVHICASDPFKAVLGHVPWIVASAGVSGAKVMHLIRLMKQESELKL